MTTRPTDFNSEQSKSLRECLKKLIPTASDRLFFLQYLAEQIINTFLACPENSQFEKLNFITCSACRFVNGRQVQETKGPLWWFGSHHKFQKHDVLIGHIHFIGTLPLIFLGDGTYDIACVIVFEKGANLFRFINRCVLIKEFRVFTEIHNKKYAHNYAYLFIKSSDIMVLGIPNLDYRPAKLLNIGYFNTLKLDKRFKFEVVRKSSFCLCFRGLSPTVWFEIKVEENNKFINKLLGFGPELIHEAMLIEPGVEYVLHYTNPFSRQYDYEINRVRPNLPLIFINERNVYVEIFLKVSTIPVEDVDTTLELLKKDSFPPLVNFKGKLALKKLKDPLGSRTNIKVNNHFYGTPGAKTHVLEFLNSSENESVDLYLNNWERKLIPFGLIPDMEIIVYNVTNHTSKKNVKYLKSTAFTYFEIVDYQPLIFFDTANLWTTYRIELLEEYRTHYSFLGYGFLLPNNIIIWSRTYQLQIRSIKIRCVNCPDGKCCCNPFEGKQDLTMTLKVWDPKGAAIVLVKDFELLRKLFGIINPNRWLFFLNAFKSIRYFDYKRNCPNPDYNDPEAEIFCRTLRLFIEFFNAKNICKNLALKCRKMEKKELGFGELSFWYCLEVEFIK